jgi:hypothetical protein
MPTRFTQDLIGAAQFLHLALEQLQALSVITGLRRWSRSSARLLTAPAAQRIRRAADLPRNRGHRRPLRHVIAPVLADHTYSPVPDFR